MYICFDQLNMKVRITFNFFIAICFLQTEQLNAQVIESINPVNDAYKSISYKIHDSSYILNTYGKAIRVHRGIYNQINCSRAIYSPSGNYILGHNNIGDSSELILMEPDGSVIGKHKMPYKIKSFCFGKNDTVIYLLDVHSENANLVYLNDKFQVKANKLIEVNSININNICYQKNMDMIFIGAGLNYYYIRSDFSVNGKFNTPHQSYVQSNDSSVSLLHLYSDGSYVEWMSRIDVIRKFSIEDRKNYDYNGIETNIEVFKTWALSPNNQYLLTVGFTNDVTLNDIYSKEIKTLKLKGSIVFLFFIDNKTYAYYDQQKAKVIYKKI